MDHKAIYELLAEALGEDNLTFVEDAVEPYAEIAAAKIAGAALLLRDDERLLFNQLMCLSGIDWDGLDEAGKGKSAAILGYGETGQPETSDRVAEGDLGVAYHLYSHRRRHKFTLRVKVPRNAASVPSVGEVWDTARWHEREAWDLLGIRFEGHPDLRRILLEDHWEGHPLRKDYVMPSRWDGVQLHGEPLAENPFTPPAAPAAPQADKPAETAPDTSGNAPKDGDAPAEG